MIASYSRYRPGGQTLTPAEDTTGGPCGSVSSAHLDFFNGIIQRLTGLTQVVV